MRALVQRVRRARVLVDERVTGAIGRGLLVLLGAGRRDGEPEARWVARKVAELRIFPDGEGRMNHDVRRGRRPDFTAAAPPEPAAALVERFCAELESLGPRVERGVFGAHMEVELVNDGPVTLMIESPGAAEIA